MNAFNRCLSAGLLSGLLTIAAFASPNRVASSTPTLYQRSPASLGTLIVSTEPNAIVWLDEIRRGTTDTTGKLSLKVLPGRHNLRVRANGFKEATSAVLPARRGNIVIKLVATKDPAELTFQQAETAREAARDAASKQQAADLYRSAIELRPAFPAAHLGLARVLMDLGETPTALEEIEAARRTRPNYPEASAVEGRIHRENASNEQAIASFRRAIREGRGFQPEAHVGLARIWEEKGQYDDAATEYELALKQLSESEPVIYQLLGAVYEKLQKPKEAVRVYEKYLEIAPNGSYASAIRSIIDQLRREAAGQQLLP